jgi:flagellar hook-associated protein 2
MATIRIGGLVSGMDIPGTIQKILDVEAKNVTTEQTKATAIQSDVSAWADVSADMTTLTDALDTLRSYELWNKINAESSDTTALSAVAAASAAPAEYSIVVDHLAQAHTVASDSAAALHVADSKADLIAGGVLTAGETFTIEGVTFTVGANEYGVTAAGKETLSSLRVKINAAAGDMTHKVFASILDNRLVIARVDTGSTLIAATEPGAAGGATPLQDLGVFSGGSTFKAANVFREARDAVFTVNGAAVTRSTNKNSDVIENVTFKLLRGTEGAAVTLKVSRDAAAPKAAILDFVNSYNAAVDKLTKYGQVEINGAAKAVVGELQGDPLVPTLLYNLRRLATSLKAAYMSGNDYTHDGRSGNMDSLEDIGVWTTGRENQLSVIDETRLDDMLENSPEAVEQMFRGVYVEGQGYQHGVAGDFYAYCYSASTPLTGSIAQRMLALDEQYAGAETNIGKMLDAITTHEASLWAQFTAMENAMAQMQADTSWITSSK